MKIYLLLLICGELCLTSCDRNKPKAEQELPKRDTVVNFDLAKELVSHFKNKVQLDTLLTKITHQEKVKVLAELTEKWDDEKQIYYYSDSSYNFKLKVIDQQNFTNSNTIFFDGKKQINFKDYSPICFKEKRFHCENYGFNSNNTLDKPKVIEVCSRRFLYSNLTYWCNGIGCGCNIIFIYDLDSHTAVFLENYRLPFDGYFISDFNNDNIPDLLVISQSEKNEMKGFKLEEFEVKLTVYSYDNNTFKVKWDNLYQRPFCYELYSVTESYHHSYHTHRTYAVTKDNWFRP